jgi:hypothetical protein
MVCAMWGWLLAAAAGAYGVGVLRAVLAPRLSASAYPSPSAAEAEIDALAAAYPELCRIETLGSSSEGRPLRVLRIRAVSPGDEGVEESRDKPRLLVTAQLHAVEFVGSFVARAVARKLVEGYGRDGEISALLEGAEVWIAPLLNPDGAQRVWRRGGFSGLAGARVTSNGVDPNRNFPSPKRCRSGSGRGAAWNSARGRPGSAYYRGPHPLSEPETAALARLCERERFCAAVNFHSFGGVVYMPAVADRDGALARGVLEVFTGAFQSRQPRLRYRPIPERWTALDGQFDAFLLAALGTPSVTVEVSRPGLGLLKPSRLFNVFWIANPEDPERWVRNDADAAIYALCEVLARSGGRSGEAPEPELADSVLARGDF